MKLHHFHFALLFITFLLSPKLAAGQTVDTFFGCDDLPPPGTGAACTICSFDILYGSTIPFTPSPPSDFCGTIENDQYIGFVAGPSGSIEFLISPFNCTMGNGVQVGIFDQFNQLVGDCLFQVFSFDPQSIAAVGLTPNEVYYIRIDGFAGDFCEFNIEKISGEFADTGGGFQTVVTDNQSVITYIPSLCEEEVPTLDTLTFDGCSYATQYLLDPNTLPYEVRTIGDLDSFQVITWPDAMARRVLLYLDLDLVSNNSAGNCQTDLELPYYSHFLDLGDNGPIHEKTWSCSSSRLVGTIRGDDASNSFRFLEAGMQTYTLSAAGYHGFGGDFDDELFVYRIVQGANVLATGSFTENDFEDVVTINHNNGPAVIQFTNSRPWSMEVAIERANPAEPWSFDDILAQGALPECVSSFVGARGITSPQYSQLQDPNLTFQFEVLSSTLLNSGGASFPTFPVLRSNIGNPTFTVDSIALPGELPPDNYIFTARVRSIDDLTTACGTNEDFEFRYDFELTEPADSVFSPSLILNAQRDPVELFTNLGAQFRIITNETGTYYRYFDCSVYIQTIIPPPVGVFLGVDTLCAGECLLAPTGEPISCVNGSFSFLASNDTTYFGELVLISFEELQLGPIDFLCNSTNSEWTVTFSWTGGESPYTLDGQIFVQPLATLGSFANGDTIQTTLFGSGMCSDTVLINQSFSCVSSTTTIQSLGFNITQRSTSLVEVSAPTYGWKLSLVDVLGREVLTTDLQRDNNQLFVGDLLRGTYFIVVQNGNQLASEKWVKR